MMSATLALSAAVAAIGFSQNVGMPRSTAASVSSACAGVAAATTTPSIPEDSSSSTESAGCGIVFRGDGGDELWPLVGDHQAVDAVQAAEGVGVEGADAAQSDHAECGHGVLRSSWSRSATSSCSGVSSSASAASTVSTWRRRGEAADRLVEVEVGGERVALGGRDDDVVQLALRAARGLHREQRRIDGPHHRGAVQRLHRPAERRRDLQQVGHPPDIGRDVGSGAVVQRGIEEHRVAGAQRHLHVVFGEELDELRPVERDVAAEEALRVGQQHRRPALDRHVAVGHRALQGEHRRRAVHDAPGRRPGRRVRRSRGDSRGAEPVACHRD